MFDIQSQSDSTLSNIIRQESNTNLICLFSGRIYIQKIQHVGV